MRINFRGVGQSAGTFNHGIGELADALAALRYARERWPQARFWLAGFSFGAWIALQLAALESPQKLITVAPPVGRWDFSAFTAPNCPWLLLQGDADDLVDAQAVVAWAGSLPQPAQIALLAGAGHFFHGRLHELEQLSSVFLEAL